MRRRDGSTEAMFYRLGKFPRRFPGREPFEVLYMRLKRTVGNI